MKAQDRDTLLIPSVDFQVGNQWRFRVEADIFKARQASNKTPAAATRNLPKRAVYSNWLTGCSRLNAVVKAFSKLHKLSGRNSS